MFNTYSVSCGLSFIRKGTLPKIVPIFLCKLNFQNCENEFHNHDLFENRINKHKLVFNEKWGIAQNSIIMNSPLH